MSKIFGYRSFVSLSLSLSLSLSHAHTHTHTNIHSPSLLLALAPPCSLSRPPLLSRSYAPPFSLTLPRALSHTHSLPSSASQSSAPRSQSIDHCFVLYFVVFSTASSGSTGLHATPTAPLQVPSLHRLPGGPSLLQQGLRLMSQTQPPVPLG
jgi:hypothetical protein